MAMILQNEEQTETLIKVLKLMTVVVLWHTERPIIIFTGRMELTIPRMESLDNMFVFHSLEIIAKTLNLL